MNIIRRLYEFHTIAELATRSGAEQIVYANGGSRISSGRELIADTYGEDHTRYFGALRPAVGLALIEIALAVADDDMARAVHWLACVSDLCDDGPVSGAAAP